jgi:thioredoxin-like negative regulator of GroEL
MWRLQDDSDIAGWVMSDLLTRIEQYLRDERYTSSTGLVEDCKAEIARLQARLTAAREKCVEIMAEYGNTYADSGKYDAADEILRALDGEVKP